MSVKTYRFMTRMLPGFLAMCFAMFCSHTLGICSLFLNLCLFSERDCDGPSQSGRSCWLLVHPRPAPQQLWVKPPEATFPKDAVGLRCRVDSGPPCTRCQVLPMGGGSMSPPQTCWGLGPNRWHPRASDAQGATPLAERFGCNGDFHYGPAPWGLTCLPGPCYLS